MKKNLQELLKKTLSQNSDDVLECDMARYSSLYGDVVYPEIMRLLTGKTLTVRRSKHYWRKALALRDGIRGNSDYHIGIRASLLEVVQNKSGEFKNLIFIEAKNLDSILHSSNRDGLTGLYNQTYLKTLLSEKIQMRRRSDDTTSALILLDLDFFKLYNDSCGHIAGDKALCIVAGIIREQIREQDVAARYGGDEFAVYLPNVTKKVALAVASRIRKAIEATDFPCQVLLNGRRLTTSSGIAFFSEDTRDVKTLIELADRDLYAAKRLLNDLVPKINENKKHQLIAGQDLRDGFSTIGKNKDQVCYFV